MEADTRVLGDSSMPATLLCVQRDRELGRQNPSLVVLDLYLPRQDGFEILTEMRMRPESKTLPVSLCCGGDVTDEFVTRARKLGAFGVESAPVEADRPVARVAEQIGSPEDQSASAGRHSSEGSLRELPTPEILRGLCVDALDGELRAELADLANCMQNKDHYGVLGIPCREGVKLAKDREKPYLLLGRLYRAIGRAGAAKKMFTRAVEIRPQCVEAMRELRIMNMRRDKDKGVLKRIFRR
jgi:CheY-like chemotaxis protein